MGREGPLGVINTVRGKTVNRVDTARVVLDILFPDEVLEMDTETQSVLRQSISEARQ